MKLSVLKITKKPSKHGGYFYYIFFTGDDGRSYKTCVCPDYINFRKNGWNKVIEKGVGCILEYQNKPASSHVNADICFAIREA